MAKKEASADFWVHDLTKEAGLELHPQALEIR